MKPVLKAFDCTDHDPIADWVPKDADAVDYHLCLHIGPAESDGADLFYVRVLARPYFETPIPQRSIALKNYSWAAVKREVEAILGAVDAENWDSVALKLSRSFDWEFDGYTEYKDKI